MPLRLSIFERVVLMFQRQPDYASCAYGAEAASRYDISADISYCCRQFSMPLSFRLLSFFSFAAFYTEAAVRRVQVPRKTRVRPRRVRAAALATRYACSREAQYTRRCRER